YAPGGELRGGGGIRAGNRDAGAAPFHAAAPAGADRLPAGSHLAGGGPSHLAPWAGAGTGVPAPLQDSGPHGPGGSALPRLAYAPGAFHGGAAHPPPAPG